MEETKNNITLYCKKNQHLVYKGELETMKHKGWWFLFIIVMVIVIEGTIFPFIYLSVQPAVIIFTIINVCLIIFAFIRQDPISIIVAISLIIVCSVISVIYCNHI